MDDIIFNLMIHSNERTIRSLSASSCDLNCLVNKNFKNKDYWKRKVEELLKTQSHQLERNWREIFKQIYNEKTDQLRNLTIAMFKAAEIGNEFLIDLLLINNLVDPSTNDNFAALLACVNGHSNVVNKLSKYSGIDPSFYDNVSLYIRC